MNYLEHYQESMPTVLPYLHLEGYIMMRQCFRDPVAAVSIDSVFNSPYLTDIASSDIERQARALAEPLGAATKSAVGVLRFEGEQSLATTSEFKLKLQGYLRDQYNSAVDHVNESSTFIPPFPFESRTVISSLLNGPHGKRAVEQIRQMLTAEEAL